MNLRMRWLGSSTEAKIPLEHSPEQDAEPHLAQDDVAGMTWAAGGPFLADFVKGSHARFYNGSCNLLAAIAFTEIQPSGVSCVQGARLANF